MLNVAKGIAPDPQDVVDVFLPEALVLVGDIGVWLRMVIGACGHVGRNGAVVANPTTAHHRSEGLGVGGAGLDAVGADPG